MDVESFERDLKSGKIGKKATWQTLATRCADHPLSGAQIATLRDLLLNETDLDVRTTGIICLDKQLRLQSFAAQDVFHEWLFTPFRRLPDADARTPRFSSLVLTVCDEEYIRDVQAQVEIARHLPTTRYPDTVFRHVPMHSPDWADVGLDRAQAVCFIGRPSMFTECKLVDYFPRELRFRFVPPQAGSMFHSLAQARPNAGVMAYPTTQDMYTRHDYAVVQRFVMQVGARDVTVVIIAGATSLGTAGAAQWIASFNWGKDRRTEYARLAGLDVIDSSTKIEVLLTVSAQVHNPPRPWHPGIEERALFIGKSRNLLRAPSRISLVITSASLQTADDVRYILFDNDELELSPIDHAAVSAVCIKYILDGQPDMALNDLLSDKRLWPKGICPVKGDRVNFFRDHLQRRGFNGIVEVGGQDIHLKTGSCRIDVLPHG